MTEAIHPTLNIRCRDDGAIYAPKSGNRKEGWTYGANDGKSYRTISIQGIRYKMHALIAEAFYGLRPEDKPYVDHINRCPWDNRVENLRYVSPKENSHNSHIYLTRDIAGLPHKGSSEWHDYHKEYCKKWYLDHKEYTKAKYTTEEYRKKT